MTFNSFESWSSHASTLCGAEAALMRAAAPAELVHMLWTGLKRGCFQVREAVTEPDEVSVTIVHATKVPAQTPGIERSSNMLDDVLRGVLQKEVSYTHDVAASTVALALKLGLERMGLFVRFSRVPLAIPLLAHAARGAQSVSVRVQGDLPSLPGDECCVRLQRTDSALADCLSNGELTVAAALLEGKSYQQIAQLRGTSLRTVANQICSVGRKLSTRGRFDLLTATLRRGARHANTSTTPPASGVVGHGSVTGLRAVTLVG